MSRRHLEKTFCWKISGELKLFKYRILKLKKEEIYQAAYQIDHMVCIYEVLLDMSRHMPEEALKAAIAFPDILPFLYGRWLKYEDSHMEEIQDCLKEELTKQQDTYRKRKIKEQKGQAA